MRVAAFLVANLASLMLGYQVGVHGIKWPNLIDVIDVEDGPPVPGDGLHLLVIYETDDRVSMPAGQRSIIDSVPVRQWLREKGFVDENHKSTARFFDPQTELVEEDQWFRDALALKTESLPWMIVSNGKSGFSGPLPKTIEEFKAVVGRFAK